MPRDSKRVAEDLIDSKLSKELFRIVSEGIALFNGQNSLDECAIYTTARIIVAINERDYRGN